MALQRLDDAPADGVVADQRERPDRDLAAELVGHHGQHAWDRLAAGRPRRGVGRVGVHHTVDLRHVLVDIGMRGGVGGRSMITFDQPSFKIGDHHGLRGELVVADARRLDHQQIPAGHSGRDIAGRPHDKIIPRQLGVQCAHLAPESGDVFFDIAERVRIELHDVLSCGRSGVRKVRRGPDRRMRGRGRLGLRLLRGVRRPALVEDVERHSEQQQEALDDARVSHQTVSWVLKASPSVRDSTRQRVQEAMEPTLVVRQSTRQFDG